MQKRVWEGLSKTVRSQGWRSRAYTDVFTACFGEYLHARFGPARTMPDHKPDNQDPGQASSHATASPRHPAAATGQQAADQRPKAT